jgi:hypothetical protein
MRMHRIGSIAVASAATGAMLLAVNAPAARAAAPPTSVEAVLAAEAEPAPGAGPAQKPGPTAATAQELRDHVMEYLEPLLKRTAELRGISAEALTQPVEEQLDLIATRQLDPGSVLDLLSGLLDTVLGLLTGLLDIGGLAPELPELPELDLPGLDLPGLELPGTELPNTELPDAELPNTELPDAELPNTDLPDIELPDAELPNTTLPDPVRPGTERP